MNRSRVVLLAAAAAAIGSAGCFDDPTSGLRDSALILKLSRSATVVVTGHSIEVSARLTDGQGVTLPSAGIAWSSADAAIATVTSDTVTTPGALVQRAFIRGVTVNGGITQVTATVGGVSSTIRVVVVPELTPPGFYAQSGTPAPDTLGTAYTAADTITFSATSLLEFDAGSSTVLFGTNPGYLLSRSATQIKAMARSPHRGRVSVTNVRFLGNAQTGEIVLDQIQTDSIDVAQARFRGTASVSGGILLTVTAPAGLTFNTSGAARSRVFFAADSAAQVTISSTQIQVTATANYTGGVTIRNVNLGTFRFDSLKTTSAQTIARATFPGTVTTAGKLLDTITVTPTGGATLNASTSVVLLGTDTAFVVSRSASSMKVIARKRFTGPATVTNVSLSGVNFPSLNTASSLTITTTATGEPNEPANDSRFTATALAFAGAADTITRYGSADCQDDGTACPGNGDVSDYYILTTTATTNIRLILTWFGNGTAGVPYGSDLNNPDLDVLICDTTASCSYGSGARLLTGFQGAGLSQPEVAATTTAQPAGTYFIRTFGFATNAPITYRLQVIRF